MKTKETWLEQKVRKIALGKLTYQQLQDSNADLLDVAQALKNCLDHQTIGGKAAEYLDILVTKAIAKAKGL